MAKILYIAGCIIFGAVPATFLIAVFGSWLLLLGIFGFLHGILEGDLISVTQGAGYIGWLLLGLFGTISLWLAPFSSKPLGRFLTLGLCAGLCGMLLLIATTSYADFYMISPIIIALVLILRRSHAT